MSEASFVPSPIAFVTPTWQSRSDAVFWLEWVFIFAKSRLTHYCSENFRWVLLETIGFIKVLLDVENHLPVPLLLEQTKRVYDCLCKEKDAFSPHHCSLINCCSSRNDLS